MVMTRPRARAETRTAKRAAAPPARRCGSKQKGEGAASQEAPTATTDTTPVRITRPGATKAKGKAKANAKGPPKKTGNPSKVHINGIVGIARAILFYASINPAAELRASTFPLLTRHRVSGNLFQTISGADYDLPIKVHHAVGVRRPGILSLSPSRQHEQPWPSWLAVLLNHTFQ